MKILILSSNNGGGHNSVAKALLEEANEQNIACTVIDAMIFLSPKQSEEMEKLHTNAALHAPSLFKAGNSMAIRLEQKVRYTNRAQTRAVEHLKQFVLSNQFDAIIATQVFAAILLTEMRARTTKMLLTCFVVTDYCYIPFTAMTNMHAYFLPHQDVIPAYSQNIGERLFLPYGIPVSRQIAQGHSKDDARMELDIDPRKKMILVLSGSMGFGDVKAVCRELLKTLAGTANIYVLCGRNKQLYQELADLSRTDQTLHPVEYVDCVGTYLDASDVVLSKPGGLSATEVSVKGKPLIFTKPIPGWEEENVRFLTARGMAFVGETPVELATLTRKLITEDAIGTQMIESQKKHSNGYAARDILNFLEKRLSSN